MRDGHQPGEAFSRTLLGEDESGSQLPVSDDRVRERPQDSEESSELTVIQSLLARTPFTARVFEEKVKAEYKKYHERMM
jgi:methyl coenzyme M reductase subunit C-like uncharacterized protein (methanogenesis marker protein 7)